MKNNNTNKRILGGYPMTNVIITTTVALFVTGLLGIILIHTKKISYLIRDNIEIHVYLERNLNTNQLNHIKKSILKQPFILKKNNEAHVVYISKQQAAEKFIKETGEKFWEVLETNPLRDMFKIKIDYKFQSKKILKIIKKRIEKINGVYEAVYTKNLTTYINKNIYKLTIILAFFSVILLLSVTIMINNTIKLALFSQRFLIKSMQLVGAFPSFIKKPFLIRAGLVGLISGLLSNILILTILEYANIKSKDIAQLQSPVEIFWILFLVTFLGISVDILSTYRAVNKYLKMKLDDLY